MTSSSDTVLSRIEDAARGRQQAAPRAIQIRRSERDGRRRGGGGPKPKRGIDDPFVYTIYTETHPDVISGRRAAGADDEMVRQLKARINASEITRRYLYQFVGEGPGFLFRDNNSAYNLEYGLGERPTITLQCLRRWLAVFGEQVVVCFQNVENGWHDNLLALRDEVLRADRLSPVPPDVRALAEAARAGGPEDCQNVPAPNDPGAA